MDAAGRAEIAARLDSDLPFYSEKILKIRTKDERLILFKFNLAQSIVHRRLEQQKRETGMVRALILKGRQFGISTLIAARFYHRTTRNKRVNTFILSHERPSTEALFSIVDRFQNNNPLAPHVARDNVNELMFDNLDSSYTVATAGGRPSGRSRTLSLFHGSEAALWPNARQHFAASLQSVAQVPGSEIVLETTSAGPGGEFHARWQEAVGGVGDYIAIFLPWSLDPGYTRQPPEGFELSNEIMEHDEFSEADYAEAFGLSLGQMCWRRNKIIELGSPLTFKREYPMTPDEAFTFGEDSAPFISPVLVARARQRQVEGAGPLIIGVDPAGNGGDRFSIAARRGGRVLWVKYRTKVDTLEGSAWVRQVIDDEQPARVNIDAGGIGAAIVTNLKAMGPTYASIVRGVNFGGTSQWKLAKPAIPGPFNRRAEMWDRCRQWLELPEGVSLPDDQALMSDLCTPEKRVRLNNDFLLESKEDLRHRGIRSPDLADAVVLTFASLEFFKDWVPAPQRQSFGNNLESKRPAPQVEHEFKSHPQSWMG